MSSNSIIEEIREALQGRPGQPIVLGVCNTLASRMGWETWCVRLAVIVSVLFFTGFTLVAYVVAGLLLKETEARTRGFFAGLVVITREWTEKISSSFSRTFYSPDSGNRGY
jgi:phage shock protein PspC (stress-responsive transcriptional regulator)